MRELRRDGDGRDGRGKGMNYGTLSGASRDGANYDQVH